MRFIRKQGGGAGHLNAAHAHPPQTPQQATSRWASFGYKPQVLQCLLEEQYFLCCYSELRADQESLGYHIEHVYPKSSAPARTFDYLNLAASALSSNDLSRLPKADQFGGHAKRSDHDPQRFISCHRPDCARFFGYLSDGRVVPAVGLDAADVARADYTIKLLNLNSPYLMVLRKRWWDELDALHAQHQANDWSLEHLIALDVVPTGGALSPFFSLTRQFFGATAELVLQQQAPALV